MRRMRRLILPKRGQPASAPSCGSPPHSILMQFSPIIITLSIRSTLHRAEVASLTLYRGDPAGRAAKNLHRCSPRPGSLRGIPHEPSGPKNRMFSRLVLSLSPSRNPEASMLSIGRSVGTLSDAPPSAANELYQS